VFVLCLCCVLQSFLSLSLTVCRKVPKFNLQLYHQIHRGGTLLSPIRIGRVPLG
jgi:hypothetical protein